MSTVVPFLSIVQNSQLSLMYKNKRVVILECTSDNNESIVKLAPIRKDEEGFQHEVYFYKVYAHMHAWDLVPAAMRLYTAGAIQPDQVAVTSLNEYYSNFGPTPGPLYFMVMERLDMDMTRYVVTCSRQLCAKNMHTNVAVMLFQVLFVLTQLNRCLGFLHGDLHSSNVFLKRLPEKTVFQYNVNDTLYSVSTSYVPVLADMYYATHRSDAFKHTTWTHSKIQKIKPEQAHLHDFRYLLMRLTDKNHNYFYKSKALTSFAHFVLHKAKTVDDVFGHPVFAFLKSTTALMDTSKQHRLFQDAEELNAWLIQSHRV